MLQTGSWKARRTYGIFRTTAFPSSQTKTIFLPSLILFSCKKENQAKSDGANSAAGSILGSPSFCRSCGWQDFFFPSSHALVLHGVKRSPIAIRLFFCAKMCLNVHTVGQKMPHKMTQRLQAFSTGAKNVQQIRIPRDLTFVEVSNLHLEMKWNKYFTDVNFTKG